MKGFIAVKTLQFRSLWTRIIRGGGGQDAIIWGQNTYVVLYASLHGFTSQCVSAMTQGFRESKLLVCKVEPRWLHVHASITNIDILFDAMDRKLDHNTMIFVDYAYDLMKILRNNHHLMDSI